MKDFMTFAPSFKTRPLRAAGIATLTLLAALQGAQAQPLPPSFCASDGQPRQVQLLERFINADCESCWQDPATPKAHAGQMVLDWVVPNDAGGKGEEAPLSAVASRDGFVRLQALGKSVPAQTLASTLTVKPLKGATLRVAHGLPLSGYVGTSLAATLAPGTAGSPGWTAWLALVEALPPGTEGSPVERHLVRNMVQIQPWPNQNGHKQLSKKERVRFFESRAMSVAPGADTARLGVVGWLQDGTGRVVLAAQSRCKAL